MEQKRINLFQKFRNSASSSAEFDEKYPTYDSWVSTNFKNDGTVKTLFDKTIRAKDSDGKSFWSDTLAVFFQTFACDLSSIKYSNYCVQEGFPKWHNW